MGQFEYNEYNSYVHVDGECLTMMSMNNMDMENKVLVLGHVGMGTGEVEPFDQVFKQGKLLHRDPNVDGIDALVIWGGEDISPSLYNEETSKYTGASDTPSYRDRVEVAAAQACIDAGIPIIGVCRGAQLLCALAGGKLIQHVNHHTRDHFIRTNDGRRIMSSSVHHQMMYPFDVEHELLAWSDVRQSNVYIVGDDSNFETMYDYEEPEVVWFPKIKGLAIQGHPEFHMNPEIDPFVQYCIELVKKYVVA